MERISGILWSATRPLAGILCDWGSVCGGSFFIFCLINSKIYNCMQLPSGSIEQKWGCNCSTHGSHPKRIARSLLEFTCVSGCIIVGCRYSFEAKAEQERRRECYLKAFRMTHFPFCDFFDLHFNERSPIRSNGASWILTSVFLCSSFLLFKSPGNSWRWSWNSLCHISPPSAACLGKTSISSLWPSILHLPTQLDHHPLGGGRAGLLQKPRRNKEKHKLYANKIEMIIIWNL